jgi:hypothetical protein
MHTNGAMKLSTGLKNFRRYYLLEVSHWLGFGESKILADSGTWGFLF